MSPIIRHLIALSAAYAIALQAILGGMVILTTVAGSQAICAPAAHGNPNPTDPGCPSCPLPCGPSGLPTGFGGDSAAAGVVEISERVRNIPDPVTPATGPRLLPQPRAPPAA